MNPALGGGICYVLSSIVMLINLFLVGIPVHYECKEEIRWYQTPFLFVLFFTGDGMIYTGALIAVGGLDVAAYVFLGVAVVGLIFIILIIFCDKQTNCGVKTGVFFGFLALLALFFCLPLFLRFEYLYFLYVDLFIYSIGPIECLIGALIYQKYYIIPIVNVFMVALFNILRTISFIGYGLLLIMNIIGLISCVTQIIVYFMYRSKRDLQNTIQPGPIYTDNPYQQQMVVN